MSMAIRLNLREFLEANNLKPARVEQHAREILKLPLGENTIYRMMGNTEPKRLDVEALNSIMASASDLLGRSVTVADLLAYQKGEKSASMPAQAS
jgi:hypothetical protein